MTNTLKETQNKQPRSLLDFILLQLLDAEPMRAQQLILDVRQTLGLCLDPEALDSVLVALKLQGFVEIKANVDIEEPAEPYRLTSEGRNALTRAENLLISAYKGLSL